MTLSRIEKNPNPVRRRSSSSPRDAQAAQGARPQDRRLRRAALSRCAPSCAPSRCGRGPVAGPNGIRRRRGERRERPGSRGTQIGWPDAKPDADANHGRALEAQPVCVRHVSQYAVQKQACCVRDLLARSDTNGRDETRGRRDDARNVA